MKKGKKERSSRSRKIKGRRLAKRWGDFGEISFLNSIEIEL